MPRIVSLLSAALLLVPLGEAGRYLAALSDGVDWLYDENNRDAAINILAAHTKLAPQYATQTYDYYTKDLKPFSRHLQIAPGVVDSTVNTLVQIGDIEQSEIQRSKVIDASYLPK
jgi:hypothetical protein